MENIITKTDQQYRKARDYFDAAIVRIVNEAEYEIERQEEALAVIDSLISMMSCTGNNGTILEALKGLVDIEESFKESSIAAKLTAQTDVRMNIDRDIDALKERVAMIKHDYE
jgi:hypothetical protein